MVESPADTKDPNWNYKYNTIPVEDGKSKEIEASEKKNYWEEYKATAISNLGKLIAGIHFVWVSSILPELLSDKSQVKITMPETVWVMTFLQIGCIPGPIIGSILGDRWGRRKTIILISFPFFIASLITVFATNVIHLCIARFFAGLGVGAVYSVIPMYIGEIASPEIRGLLGISYGLIMSFGILLSFVLAACVSMQTNAIICLFLPVIMFVLTYTYLPESPYFYILKQDYASAEKALQIFRKKSNVAIELKRMQDGYEIDKGNHSFTDIFTIRANRKGLIIIAGLIFASQCNGTIAVLKYSQMIFQIVNSSVPIEICGIILALSNFVITFVVGAVIDTLGRRILLIISCILTMLSLIVLAMYFYLQDVVEYSNLSSYTFAPLIIIIFLKFGYGFGVGPIPFIILSEIFPTSVKAQCNSIAVLYAAILGIVAVKTYEMGTTYYGYVLTFGVYVVINVFVLIFVYVWVPETKGLPLEEIHENLRKSNKRDK